MKASGGFWMDLGLTGRVAIVAAASQGLGKAVALGLAREGARVAICARNETNLQAAAADIRAQTGAEVLARVADVTQYSQVRGLVAATVEHFGAVDICVSNAGGPPTKSFADTTLEDWHAAVELNFISTVHFAREVLPIMQRRQWGRFIAITSMTVKQPAENLILSNSVRSAVSGLVKSLANEYGPHNILVNNVCPGRTATARLKSMAAGAAAAAGVAPEMIERQWAAEVPLGRLGQPEEFASLVVFLASERASYINGVSIAVDGGLVKGVY
jgi:3-oxoacyl-[acyl-carrier protein] reductase